MRPLAAVLALLLAVTPATQVLAQVKQGPSTPEADASSRPRIVAPASSGPGPTLRVPEVTANTAPLLRPAQGDASLNADSLSVYDAAPISEVGRAAAAIGVLLVVVVGVLFVAYCSGSEGLRGLC